MIAEYKGTADSKCTVKDFAAFVHFVHDAKHGYSVCE